MKYPIEGSMGIFMKRFGMEDLTNNTQNFGQEECDTLV